jgi:hypothetical protein
VVLLGVNSDEDRDKARAALARHGSEKRSWWDGNSGPIAARWRVSGWPTIYILDAAGVVRYRSHRLDRDAEAVVARLLRDPPSP